MNIVYELESMCGGNHWHDDDAPCLVLKAAARIEELEDKLRRIAELCDFSADVPCIGFDNERYIPSAAIRAIIEEVRK